LSENRLESYSVEVQTKTNKGEGFGWSLAVGFSLNFFSRRGQSFCVSLVKALVCFPVAWLNPTVSQTYKVFISVSLHGPREAKRMPQRRTKTAIRQRKIKIRKTKFVKEKAFPRSFVFNEDMLARKKKFKNEWGI